MKARLTDRVWMDVGNNMLHTGLPLLIVLLVIVTAVDSAAAGKGVCNVAEVQRCYRDIFDSVPAFFSANAENSDPAGAFCRQYWEYSSCAGKAATKACRGEELVERMEGFYKEVSAELCGDPQLRLLKSFAVVDDCSPLDRIWQCMARPLRTFRTGTEEGCSTLERDLRRCLSEPASICSSPVDRVGLAKRSTAAFLKWHGCQATTSTPTTNRPRPVDPFLEECPFQLHEMCLQQSVDIMRATLIAYGRTKGRIHRFYKDYCDTAVEPCRPEDSLDKCTTQQRDTMQRFHQATAAAQQTLCAAQPELLANLTATHTCWDEKLFRECALGDATKPLGRHLLGVARTGEQCRQLRSSWSECLRRSYGRLRRCEETPDVEGARTLLLDFLDRLQSCGTPNGDDNVH